MKKLTYLKSFILLAILLFASCGREVTVTTIINRDGSCDRIIRVKTDSIDFFSKEYPIPIDTTWNLTVDSDTTESGKFIYTARKKFNSITELNELYVNDTGYLAKIDRTVELEKRFRWFHTFFTYKEVYTKMFDQPSLSSYLNEVEMNYYELSSEEKKAFLLEINDSIKAKNFDDKVEEKTGMWIFKTIFNEYYQIFEEEAPKLNDPKLSSEILKKQKEVFNKDSLNLFTSDITHLDSSDEFLEYLDSIFQTDIVWTIKSNEFNPFKDVEEKADMFWSEDYTNNIEMPGLLMDTNAEYVSSDTISWNITWDKYFTDDFEMIVESRIVNKWTFYVSGVVVIFVISILISGSLKRKKVIKN